MASVAIEAWADDCATIEEIEDALADLRLRVGHRGVPTSGRVSSPTWPGSAGWQTAATETLAGLGEQHPSRTLLLFPSPAKGTGWRPGFFSNAIRSRATGGSLQRGRGAAPGGSRPRLRPASRCRCSLICRCSPAGAADPVQNRAVPADDRDRRQADRRFRRVAGRPGAYAELEDVFEAAAVSDIARRWTLPWREALAAWPELSERIAGPPPRRRSSPPGCTPGLESRWCARALTKFLPRGADR